MSIGTNPVVTFEVTPVIQAAAYADGDVIAVPILVDDVFEPFRQSVILQSAMVLDLGDQGSALDLIFLHSSGQIGTINSAVGPSDIVAGKINGVVEVAAADYVDLGNSMIAQPQFNPLVLSAADNASGELYVGVVSRGTPTYASTSDLVLRLGFVR